MTANGVGLDDHRHVDAAMFREAVAGDLRLLAHLHDREIDEGQLSRLGEAAFQTWLGLLLESSQATASLEAIDAAIGRLADQPGAEAIAELAVAYVDIYLSFRYRASPTESVWFDDDGLERQLPMFQVKQWYQHHNLVVCDWANRPEDHMVLQLEFVAHLLALDGAAGSLEEAARFLDAHLNRWIGLFAARLAETDAPAFYTALAGLTAAYLDELRDHLEEMTGLPRAISEPDQPDAAAMVPEHPSPGFVPGIGPSW